MAMASGEFWLPLGASSLIGADEGMGLSTINDDRSSFSLMLSGTLAPGVSAEEARARLEPLAAALEAAYPQTNANQRLVLQPRSRINFGLPPPSDAEPTIGGMVLMAIAGMVLVVACLNLANLQLARGSVRRHEIAVRLALSSAGIYGLRAYLVSQRTRELGIRFALGATRGGVVGQLLKEGAVTAAFGIAAGLALALALVQLLRRSGMLFEVGLVDPVVFAVAPLVLVVATTVASYIPARRALRIDPAAALRPE
jgi:ABC-type antimicrobial peptide transport system permease subunit